MKKLKQDFWEPWITDDAGTGKMHENEDIGKKQSVG